MSSVGGHGAVEPAKPQSAAWELRVATSEDAEQIAAAMRELLVELGGRPPDRAALEETTRALLATPATGTVFVAVAKGVLVGVLAASWQTAIHAAGSYALIQDLWVHSSWRGGKMGSALINTLYDLARERGVSRVEVGLPREQFPGVRATESFYRANGFTPLGPRMRRVLQ